MPVPGFGGYFCQRQLDSATDGGNKKQGSEIVNFAEFALPGYACVDTKSYVDFNWNDLHEQIREIKSKKNSGKIVDDSRPKDRDPK